MVSCGTGNEPDGELFFRHDILRIHQMEELFRNIGELIQHNNVKEFQKQINQVLNFLIDD